MIHSFLHLTHIHSAHALCQILFLTLGICPQLQYKKDDDSTLTAEKKKIMIKNPFYNISGVDKVYEEKPSWEEDIEWWWQR